VSPAPELLQEAWGRRYGKHLKRRGKPGHIRLYHVDHAGREHHAASFHHPDELAHWLKENRGNGGHGITIRVHGPGNALGGRGLRASEERDLVKRLDSITEHREAFRYGEHRGSKAAGAMAGDAAIGLGAMHFGPNWLPSDHQDHIRAAIEVHTGYVYHRAKMAKVPDDLAAHIPHLRHRDPILEAMRGGRRRGGGEEEFYDDEKDAVVKHAREPKGTPGGGRFAKGSPHQIAADARDKALADGHPPHIADAIHRGVLAKLGHDPGQLVRDRDSDEEYIRRRTTPAPRNLDAEEDDTPATFFPVEGHREVHNVYHRGRHVGRVAYAPNMPSIASPERGGGARGSFDVPGSWRAQVQGLEEAPTKPFHSDESPNFVHQFAYGGGHDGPVWTGGEHGADASMTRWKTVGFGDTRHEAAEHLIDRAHKGEPGDEDIEKPLVGKVTPKNMYSGEHDYDDGPSKMFLDDVLTDLKSGSTFDEIVDNEMDGLQGRPRRGEIELEIADAIRHLQKIGRWRPPGQDSRDRALEQANLAFDRARQAGHPRHKANAIRKAVYKKLAAPNPQAIPPALTPIYRDIDPETGLRESIWKEVY
jgi:hypothetical protein